MEEHCSFTRILEGKIFLGVIPVQAQELETNVSSCGYDFRYLIQ